MAIYALNLFNVKSEEEYRAYAGGAEAALKRHGGRPLLFGRLSRPAVGDIAPRQVMMVVEWESMEGINGYIHDPKLAEVHPHRDRGVSDFVWHLFDKVEDIGDALAKGETR